MVTDEHPHRLDQDDAAWPAPSWQVAAVQVESGCSCCRLLALLEVMDLATRRLHVRDLRAGDLATMVQLWTDADIVHFMSTAAEFWLWHSFP